MLSGLYYSLIESIRSIVLLWLNSAAKIKYNPNSEVYFLYSDRKHITIQTISQKYTYEKKVLPAETIRRIMGQGKLYRCDRRNGVPVLVLVPSLSCLFSKYCWQIIKNWYGASLEGDIVLVQYRNIWSKK